MAAIAAGGFAFREDYGELQALVEQHGQWWDLPSGTFEGTGVCAVLIYLGKPEPTATEPTDYRQASLF